MLLNKSVIATTVGIAALGMSAAALANGSFNAPASSGVFGNSGAGFVVGVQGGYANTHWSNLDGFVNTLFGTNVSSTDDDGFAARGFIGYDFNKFFGLEAGYTYLPTSTTTITVAGNSASGDIDSYGLDLLGKISVPVTPVFKIYAKAGLGYLHASTSGNLFAGAGPSSHTGPAYGVGASYEIVPNLAIDASWLRYSGQGDVSSSNYIPEADVALIGLSYKFPTHYS